MKKFDIFFTIAATVEAENEDKIDLWKAFEEAKERAKQNTPFEMLESIEELEEL